MPTTVAALQVVVGADISGASKGLTALNKSLGGVGGFLANAASSALGFAAATAGLDALGGLGNVVQQALGVGLANTLEQLTAQFTAMTGSADLAQKILGAVRKEADLTPFSFVELAQAAASLTPVARQSGTALFDLIRPAEVLAALRPDQGLTGAAFALREALGGDWISVTDRFDLPRQRINQLKAQGVPAIQIINTVLKEMGADMNLVAAQAQTTAGRFNTFEDLISGIRIEAGKPILAALGGELDRFSGIITSGQGGLQGFAQALGGDIALGIHTAGQELGTFLVTMQHIAAVENVDLLTAGIVTLENRIGEVFGPDAQKGMHEFLAELRTAGEWWIAHGGEVFGEVGRDLQALIRLIDWLTQRLNDINNLGPNARQAIDEILGVTGPSPDLGKAVGAAIGGTAGGTPTVPFGSGTETNIPGVPGNQIPGAAPAPPAAGSPITITFNNPQISDQLDVDAIADLIARRTAAAAAEGQSAAANTASTELVGAA